MIRLCSLQVDNIFIFIRQVASVPACWLFKNQQQFDRSLGMGVPDRVETGTSPHYHAEFGCRWSNLLTLKVVTESRVTWAISVPILAFLGLSVLELRPMYATDRRRTDRRQTKASLNATAQWGIIIRVESLAGRWLIRTFFSSVFHIVLVSVLVRHLRIHFHIYTVSSSKILNFFFSFSFCKHRRRVHLENK